MLGIRLLFGALEIHVNETSLHFFSYVASASSDDWSQFMIGDETRRRNTQKT